LDGTVAMLNIVAREIWREQSSCKVYMQCMGSTFSPGFRVERVKKKGAFRPFCNTFYQNKNLKK